MDYDGKRVARKGTGTSGPKRDGGHVTGKKETEKNTGIIPELIGIMTIKQITKFTI